MLEGGPDRKGLGSRIRAAPRFGIDMVQSIISSQPRVASTRAPSASWSGRRSIASSSWCCRSSRRLPYLQRDTDDPELELAAEGVDCGSCGCSARGGETRPRGCVHRVDEHGGDRQSLGDSGGHPFGAIVKLRVGGRSSTCRCERSPRDDSRAPPISSSSSRHRSEILSTL